MKMGRDLMSSKRNQKGAGETPQTQHEGHRQQERRAEDHMTPGQARQVVEQMQSMDMDERRRILFENFRTMRQNGQLDPAELEHMAAQIMPMLDQGNQERVEQLINALKQQ